MGRRGKSRGRVLASQKEGDAASLSTETEVATASSRPGKAAKEAEAQGAQAGLSQGGRGKITEAEDTAAVGAAPAQASQQELDFWEDANVKL